MFTVDSSELNKSMLLHKAFFPRGLVFFVFVLLFAGQGWSEDLTQLRLSQPSTEPTVCSDISLGRWVRMRNYLGAVVKTGGLRLAFRPQETSEPIVWRNGVFQAADPEKKMWMHPVLWISRKLTKRLAREPLDFQPILALEDRVLQPLIRGFTTRFLGKTLEFSRLLMIGMGLSIGWLGWGTYEAYADQAVLTHQLAVVQEHAEQWNFFLNHDHRFRQLKKMLSADKELPPNYRNHLIKEYRNKVVDHHKDLESIYIELQDASGAGKANDWLFSKWGDLFYSDILRYQRTRVFVPTAEHILLDNFVPVLQPKQLEKLVRIRNRSIFKYEFAYGLATDPQSIETRKDAFEALYRTQEERAFVRKVASALLKKEISSDKALDMLHLDITWTDQLMNYTELGVALRAKDAQGVLTGLPLTIAQIRQELIQIYQVP